MAGFGSSLFGPVGATSLAPFQPTYVFAQELAKYGLPDTDAQPDIMTMVQFASSFIDEVCGRLDGDGNGSLVYTTYVQRCLLQVRNRNLVQLPIKPITAVSQQVVDDLITEATNSSPDNNPYYTGVQANTITQSNLNVLSGIIAASGRYGYTRQDATIGYPDLQAMINPLNLVTIFGGPAPWVAMDVANMDVYPQVGEVWIPAGLQLQRYSEVLVTYNSGYDPRNMPRPIKHVCAALVKNLLSRGAGTTGLIRMSVARSGVNVGFVNELLDPTLDQMLTPYKVVRSY